MMLAVGEDAPCASMLWPARPSRSASCLPEHTEPMEPQVFRIDHPGTGELEAVNVMSRRVRVPEARPISGGSRRLASLTLADD
jgi:hypothetical protein